MTKPAPLAAPNNAAPALTHRQLALFRAIMLHGNLGRAAESTGSSQPTLSRELARLEQVLGFDLFDRVRGRLRDPVTRLRERVGGQTHRTRLARRIQLVPVGFPP